MQRVTSIQELETAIDENGEIVVSKNNKNNIVILSMEEFRKKMLKKDIEEHLLEAEDDIKNGRLKDAREVFKEWKEKYGI